MLFYQILAFIVHGKILKKSCKNNKFKISAPTWNEEFELPEGSYSVSDVQECFKYILEEHGEKKADNLLITIYVNKIKNRITFNIKQDIILNF